ncbi:dTDP-4-dehydrorhamnose 3,5-epimerase [Palleronia sp. KMU-117]|uniref:dTDP-4-dehydrorhamnose 3,5-epimerase n=1 Tax=Palleronia sp. KMU-117 TaxID=3434108 RepID=UPI003D7273EA
MQVEQTALDGVLILTPRRFGDDRGWFSEVWNRRALTKAGITADFVQDNHSMSRAKGTLRGLHYQAPPNPQAKLVRCGVGAIWDVAVDARHGSPTYGQWVGVELSAANGRQLFVPEGFLHGFSTLSEGAEVLYKCTDYYAPAADGTVAWNSAALQIDWKLDRQPELSAKDAAAPDFAEWNSPFVWEGAR